MRVRRYQRFSDFVKALRHKHRLSQRQMAKLLTVSSGYVGQWEAGLSQPSMEVAARLCRVFHIGEVEYVQRLAYATRAPDWLRESILKYERDGSWPQPLTDATQRIIQTVMLLPEDEQERLAERVVGWAEAMHSPVKRPS